MHIPHDMTREQWISQCLRRLLTLDMMATSEDMIAVVDDLAERVDWRNCEPEKAAEMLFAPIRNVMDWSRTEPATLPGRL